MTIQDAPLAARRVAGYRVLRSLGRDEEAELLLGFRERDGAQEPEVVVLKTMEPSPTRWAATVDALEALERAQGEQVVRVLDVECTDQLLCVIFERLPLGSLAELLLRRERLDAGEVVTIVAPLAAALGRMHAAGVGHGAVGARAVLFRADGAPVLIGFGSAGMVPPGSPEVVLERAPAVVSDRRALRELACLLLSRVAGSRARSARALVTELESCPEPLVFELLGRRLFEVAAAVPVRFTVDPAPAGEPARAVPIAPPVDVGPERPRWWGTLSRIIPESLVQRILDGVSGSPLAPLVAAGVRVWRRWSPRRRRLVLAVAVATAVVGSALTVIPNPPTASADAARAPGASASATAVIDASAQPDASAPSGASTGRTPSLAGDDPLAAAIILVTRRERCLRSLSQLCLEGADQPDSGALRGDREVIRAAQQGGELPDPLTATGRVIAPELVERWGDSALVRLAEATSVTATGPPSATSGPHREPASLLLVKGEAGWRIRDVIAAPTSTSEVSD
jgi:hypothetical protein